MSRYDDWIQSQKSQRVWLEDSMTALGQFAFIAPIHRVKHWNPTTKRRNKCWAREGECVFCKNGTPKINEFTYGIYVSEDKTIRYLTLTVASHTEAQRLFSTIIDNGVNPTDIDAFVSEKFRPSLTNSEEQSYKWNVPEEIVEYLKDKDGEPITMIDLFLILKEQFPAIPQKELKKYSVKLCEHNVLNLLNAREKWI